MPTKDDVRTAYRFILGREAESEAVVEEHLSTARDIATLRRRFVGSPEFFNTHSREVLRQATEWAAGRRHGEVQVDCTPRELALMFAHIRAVWSRLGEVEPHFSVVSHAAYKPGQIAAHLASFLGTGREEARMLAGELAGHGLPASGYRHCLEFGCGVGRVTRHLAALARRVTGIDVSAPHLVLARDHLAGEGVENVELAQITAPDGADLPACDLLYSRIVLQHNPPPVMLFLLRRLLAAIEPGGVGVFQLPVFLAGYRFDVAEYLAGMDRLDNQELHALPQKAVFRALADADCDVLACYRDNSLSRIDQMSNRFVVRKRMS